MQQEIWKDIQGYEGLYQVSNFGRVKSLKRKVKSGENYVTVKEKIRKQGIRKGYYYLQLHKNDISKKHSIHRLVAQAFIHNPENKPQINHRDGNRFNNNIYNLEWCNLEENIKHENETGLRPKGEKNGNSKLTEKQVLEIRENKEKLNQKQLSEKYKVHRDTIGRITNKTIWKHI